MISGRSGYGVMSSKAIYGHEQQIRWRADHTKVRSIQPGRLGKTEPRDLINIKQVTSISGRRDASLQKCLSERRGRRSQQGCGEQAAEVLDLTRPCLLHGKYDVSGRAQPTCCSTTYIIDLAQRLFCVPLLSNSMRLCHI